jgi:hypothetical protein
VRSESTKRSEHWRHGKPTVRTGGPATREPRPVHCTSAQRRAMGRLQDRRALPPASHRSLPRCAVEAASGAIRKHKTVRALEPRQSYGAYRRARDARATPSALGGCAKARYGLVKGSACALTCIASKPPRGREGGGRFFLRNKQCPFASKKVRSHVPSAAVAIRGRGITWQGRCWMGAGGENAGGRGSSGGDSGQRGGGGSELGRGGGDGCKRGGGDSG